MSSIFLTKQSPNSLIINSSAAESSYGVDSLNKQDLKNLTQNTGVSKAVQKISKYSRFLAITDRNTCLHAMTICTISFPVFWLNYCFNSEENAQSLICFDATYKYVVGAGAFFAAAIGIQSVRMMNDCRLFKEEFEV